MAEYIERESFKQKYLCCGYLPEMSEKEFDEFPAADVVQVVRCASCKYVRPTINVHTGEQVGIWCYLHDSTDVSPDAFCSRGVRKDGGENDVSD